MSFQDKHPTQIEFEFDRVALRRIYRGQAWLICWLPFLAMSCLLSLGFTNEHLRAFSHASLQYKAGITTLFLLGGLAISLPLASVFYFGYFHKAAELHANNVRLLVEGPYLRYVDGGYVVTDRRYHFRDIHTYSTIEDPVQRYFGIKSLAFYDQPRSPSIRIMGIKNADQVRDQLCEIDAARTAAE